MRVAAVFNCLINYAVIIIVQEMVCITLVQLHVSYSDHFCVNILECIYLICVLTHLDFSVLQGPICMSLPVYLCLCLEVVYICHTCKLCLCSQQERHTEGRSNQCGNSAVVLFVCVCVGFFSPYE